MTSSNNLVRDYPFMHLNYGTLAGPSTFTGYCYYPNCPVTKFPSAEYSPAFTKFQVDQVAVGQQLRDSTIHTRLPYEGTWSDLSQPVFTSNIKPLATDYMRYTMPTQ